MVQPTFGVRELPKIFSIELSLEGKNYKQCQNKQIPFNKLHRFIALEINLNQEMVQLTFGKRQLPKIFSVESLEGKKL